MSTPTIRLKAIFDDIGQELANLLDGKQATVLVDGEMLLPKVHHVLSILVPRRLQPFDVRAEANLIVEIHGQVGSEAGERGWVGARIEEMANR